MLRWVIALMMEAVGTSETLVSFYETTGFNIPEDNHLQDTNPCGYREWNPDLPARCLHPLTCLCRTHCTVGWEGVWTWVAGSSACTAPGCSDDTPVGPSATARCSLLQPLSAQHSDIQTFSICLSTRKCSSGTSVFTCILGFRCKKRMLYLFKLSYWLT
jgi:hypothetical protein